MDKFLNDVQSAEMAWIFCFETLGFSYLLGSFKAGNLLLKGSLAQSSGASPNGNDWQVKLGEGEVKAWLDDGTGNLNLKGALSQEQPSISPSGNNDFLIQFRDGAYVGMIDGGGGNMYIKGQLGVGCSLP